MLKKRFAAVFLVLVFALLAIAPETFACHRHRRTFARSYATRTYRRPYYGVASSRYVNPYYRSGMSSRTRTILTIAAPAAIGAGFGALFGGKRGAGVGALLGGGGGAAYSLYRNRHRF